MNFIKLLITFILAAGVIAAAFSPGGEHALGSYTTSLSGRTRGQRSNALLAAQRVNGAVIESGETFSFNRRVGPWSPDRGYVVALVSYDGELVTDWGGGVCQTSTTLYNAALLAGLEIVARERHTWSPKYVSFGRDAAVAQREIDLMLKNPYPWPIRIRALTNEGRIGFEILGRENGPMATVQAETDATVSPTTVMKTDSRLRRGQRRILTHGKPGVRVAVYRTFTRGSKAGQRELVSQDSYPAMNRVIAVGSAD